MPAIYLDRKFAVAGALISYGTSITSVYRQDIGAFGCLRSLRARMALDGVSGVRGGSVQSESAMLAGCYRIGVVICSLPGRRSARELGWTSVSLVLRAPAHLHYS